MDTAVELNWGAIEKAMRASPGSDIWLSLRSRPKQLDAVREAVNVVTDAFQVANPDSSLLTESVLQSPTGYLVKLIDIDFESTVQELVTELTAELTRRGLTGPLSVARSAQTPSWMPDHRMTLAAFVHYSIDLDAMTANDGRQTSWYVPEAADRRITTAAERWAHLPDAHQVLILNGFLLAGEFDDLADELRRPPNGGTRVGLQYRRRADHRANVARLPTVGEALFQIYDEDTDWRPRVTHLRDALTAAIPDTTQGFIRSAQTPAVSHKQLGRPQRLPGITEAVVRYNPHLLDRYLPDAHGIQLVTSAHLANAHDLTDWHITEIAPHRHLVEARDLTPWYSTPLPDPDTLGKARADFAGALFTKQLVHDNPPPWHPPGRPLPNFDG